MARAHITRHLARFFPDLPESVEVEGGTVAEVLASLDGLHPGIATYLVDERGALRKHVLVFVGDEVIRDRERLGDAVPPDGDVHFLQALSGG